MLARARLYSLSHTSRSYSQYKSVSKKLERTSERTQDGSSSLVLLVCLSKWKASILFRKKKTTREKNKIKNSLIRFFNLKTGSKIQKGVWKIEVRSNLRFTRRQQIPFRIQWSRGASND